MDRAVAWVTARPGVVLISLTLCYAVFGLWPPPRGAGGSRRGEGEGAGRRTRTTKTKTRV